MALMEGDRPEVVPAKYSSARGPTRGLPIDKPSAGWACVFLAPLVRLGPRYAVPAQRGQNPRRKLHSGSGCRRAEKAEKVEKVVRALRPRPTAG